jgi:predicted RNA-binding protein with PUA-like domain
MAQLAASRAICQSRGETEALFRERRVAFWLLKTEPETWSWQMQVERGARGEVWSGVRSHIAKNNLKRMKRGERAFFYHSGSTKEIVGIVQVTREAYPDPTDETGKFVAVTVKAVAAAKRPLSLAVIKTDARLAAMVLVNNTRLSVQPVTAAEWKIICTMTGLPA